MKSIKSSLYNSSALYTGLIATLAFSFSGLGARDAVANPTDGTVVAGGVTISTSGSTETITQTTGTAIINWRNFDILNGETTRFIQPGVNSVALNRILASGNPTQILGNLIANGKIFIVNPDGVFFGANSRVDVGGLIASTADISNRNFLRGNYKFNRAGKDDASIINKGHITARDGGLVALVAPGVENDGVITAKLDTTTGKGGTVMLGAAKTFSLDLYGDNLYSFALGKPTTKKASDQNGGTLAAAITNTGKISASGGTVFITARAAGEVVDQAINTTGIIQAKAARKGAGGTIILDGGSTGTVTVAGTLDASGKKNGQSGGKISVTGKDIHLTSSAIINAIGAIAGGTVNVGGEMHGAGTLAHADTVTADAGSLIDVSALDNGNGGTAVLWSDSDTEFHGSINAKGGANGGNGGSVETSGHYLNADGSVDASAANGTSGSWLLDPYNITITNSGDTTTGNYSANHNNSTVNYHSIQNVLNNGTNVTIFTGNNGSQHGDITVAHDIIKSGGNNATLLLEAAGDIILNNDISIVSGSHKLNVTLDADRAGNGGAIVMNDGSSIVTNGGNIVLGGGANASTGAAVGDASHVVGVSLTGATLSANGGDITINGAGYANSHANSAATSAHGIYVNNSSISTVGNGAITMNGVAGGSGNTAGSNIGIYVRSGSSISAVDGAISLTGTGGGGNQGGNHGVDLSHTGTNSVTSTGSGVITFTGTAGNGAGTTSYGLAINGASSIGGVTATGNINLIGDSITSSAGSTPSIQTAGTVTVKPLTAGTTVGFGDGTGSLSVTQAIMDAIHASHVIIGSSSAGALKAGTFAFETGLTNLELITGDSIEVSGNISKATTGDAALALEAGKNIVIDANKSIISTSGALNVALTADTSATAGYISLQNGSSIVSNGGDITLGGGGANGAAVSNTDGFGGVMLSNATLDATGTATGGNISLTGTAGTSFYDGIDLLGASVITNNNGTITLTGEGAALGASAPGSDGIYMTNTNLNAKSGAINITGTGHGLSDTSFPGDFGVEFGGNVAIKTISGAINITGTGANGAPGIIDYAGYHNGTHDTTIGSNATTGKITFNGNGSGILLAGDSVKTSNDIEFKTTGNLSIGNSTVTAGGNLTIDPADFALSGASAMSGTNVTIDPVANVTLTGGSTITASNNLTINNTGVFSSDTAGVLKGAVVKLNQALPGSIQNAIDAIDATSGSTTLTIGAGIWDQVAKIVGHNNFNLVGSGQYDANAHTGTLLQSTSLTGAPLVQNGPPFDGQSFSALLLAQNADNVNISGLSVDGSQVSGNVATLAYNNAGGSINSANITGGIFGIYAVDSTAFGHTAHTVNVGNTSAVSASGSAWAPIVGIGNALTLNVNNSTVDGSAGALAMDISSGTQGTISGNTITGGSIAGIAFHGAHDVTVSGGTISGGPAGVLDDGLAHGVAGASNITITGVNISNVGSGIVGNGGDSWTVKDNTITGNGSGTGVSLTNVTGTNTIGGSGHANTVDSFATGIALSGTTADVGYNSALSNTTGISLNNSSSAQIHNNTIVGGGGSTGITVDGGSSDSITNNAIASDTGILVGSTTGTSDLSITGNTIGTVTIGPVTFEGIATGVSVSNSTGVTISGNSITHVGFDGIDATSTSGLTINGNTVSGDSSNGTAIKLASDTGSNTIGASGTGNSNTITGFDSGINVSASGSTTIDNNSITGNATTAGTGITLTGDTGTDTVGTNAANTIYQVKNGASVSGGTGLQFANNSIDDAVNGIILNGTTNASVTNNTFGNSVGVNNGVIAGLVTGNSNLTINGNTLKNIVGNGIDAENGTNGVTINGNTITGTTGAGIKLASNAGTNTVGTSGSYNTVSGFSTSIAVSGGSDSTAVGYNHISNIGTAAISASGVTGLSITGNQINDAIPTTTGISVTGSNGAQVTLNDIYNVTTGISIDSSTGVTVASNLIGDTAHGAVTTGITAGNHSDNLTVASNTLNNIKGDGIDVTGSDSIAVNGNTINAALFNLSGKGISVSSLTGTNTIGTSGLFNTISNFLTSISATSSTGTTSVGYNQISGIANTGITANNVAGLTVTNNTINDTVGATGIAISGGSNGATVSNNNVYGSITGVSVNGSTGVSVTGNTLGKNTTLGGLNTGVSATNHSDGISITGNTLVNILTDGIDVTGSNGATISGNSITASTANLLNTNKAISVSSNTGTTTIGSIGNANTISGFANGIAVTGSSSTVVDNNTITGKNTTTGNGISLTNGTGTDTVGSNAANTISAFKNGVILTGETGATVANNTIFKTTNGVGISGGSNNTVSGNFIGKTTAGNGVTTGVTSTTGSSNLIVSGNTITNVSSIGIDAENGTNGVTINGNSVTGKSGSTIGIKLANEAGTNTVGASGVGNGNTISGFTNGISVATSGSTAIDNNSVTGTATTVGTGISLSNDTGTDTVGTQAANTIYQFNVGASATGGTGLVFANNSIDDTVTGIKLNGTTNASVTSNTFGNSVGVNNGVVAGLVTGNSNLTINGNTLKNIVGNGIDAENGTNGVTINGNTITGTTGTGILLANDAGASVVGTSSSFNTVSGFDTSISATGNTGTTSIAYNKLSGMASKGINASNVAGLSITNNTIHDPATYGVTVASSNDALVDNNIIYNVTTGISVDGSTGVTVSNNKIGKSGSSNAVTTGITAGNHSDNLTVASNTLTNIKGDGIDVTGSDTVVINGNSVTAALLNLTGKGINVSSLTGTNTIGKSGLFNTITNFITGILATGNTGTTSVGFNQISGIANAGIQASNIEGLTITNNTVNDVLGSTGISVASSDSAAITNNKVYGSVTGVSVNGSAGVSITGNTIGKNTLTGGVGTGITTSSSDGITITGNTLANILTDGIDVTGSNGATVSGNGITASALNLGNNKAISISGNTGTTIIGSAGAGNGNTISGFANGINVASSGDASIDNNTITGKNANTGTGINITGITGTDTVGTNAANTVSKFKTGVSVTGGTASLIENNTIFAATTGISLSGTTDDVVSGNTIGKSTSGNGVTTGVNAGSNSNLTVTGNTITNVSGTGIDAENGTNGLAVNGNIITGNSGLTATGIKLVNDTGTVTVGKLGAGNTLSNLATGISISGTTASVAYNSITSGFTGITITGSDDSSIDNNSLYGVFTGVAVDSSTGVSVTNNTIGDIALGSVNNGILITGNSDDITITGNTLGNIKVDGIDVTGSNNATINSNTISAAPTNTTGTGISLTSLTGDVLVGDGTVIGGGNTINNFGTGIHVSDTKGVKFASNVVTGNPGTVTITGNTVAYSGGSIGVLLDNGSDNASFLGDSFISNAIGIDLNNVQNTRIDGVKLTTNGIGLLVNNGAGSVDPTVVANTTFTNGAIGVMLNGEGSTMVFEGINNSFTGMPTFFALQDGAMFGQTLNASAQTFNGVRASDFTNDELALAELQTIDLHNTPGVGKVFYRQVFDLNALLAQFVHDHNGSTIPNPLFSFAGQLIGNTPPSFTVQSVNLSLLGAAGNLGTIAPAAGGDVSALSPSAGGDTFASLSPAAGGEDVCGNNFLGDGYALNYSSSTCAAK